MSKIKDIYKGEILNIWEDGEFITLALGFITIAFSEEEWDVIKEDLKKFVELLK